MKCGFASILLLIALTCPIQGNPVCESCQFEVAPEDEPECSIYGTLNGQVHAWYRATENCLVELNISMAAIPKHLLWNMCPNRNGDSLSADRLQQFLRSETEATQTVRGLFPNFFRPSNETGRYELADSVFGSNNQFIQCSRSANLCWNAIGVSLGQNPAERALLCGTTYDIQIKSLLEEQEAARMALCALEDDEDEVTTSNTTTTAASMTQNITQACQSLYDQILKWKASNAESTCSQVAVGLEGRTPPNCTTGTVPAGGTPSSGGDLTTSRTARRLGVLASLFVGYVSFVEMI